MAQRLGQLEQRDGPAAILDVAQGAPIVGIGRRLRRREVRLPVVDRRVNERIVC